MMILHCQSTEKVLILEYMDGIRLNDSESLEAFGVDKQKIVEEITRAYAHQIYVDGFFNGDPHPGTLAFFLLEVFASGSQIICLVIIVQILILVSHVPVMQEIFL